MGSLLLLLSVIRHVLALYIAERCTTADCWQVSPACQNFLE